MTTEPLRDFEQAAEFLNLSQHTLRKFVAARKIPHTRIGKHVRFSADDLARIVEMNHVEPAPSPAIRAIRARQRAS